MATDKTDPSPPPQPSRPPVSSTSSGARAHLEVTRGPEKGQTFRIAPAVTVLGRDASCEVVLSESAISRQHCRIERSGETWVLRNLSANGTRVKRTPIEEHVLADGDEIRIGAKTRILFVIEEAAVPTTGRPQFRRRGAAEEEEAEAEPAAEEAPPSLFQRRKGLFIGLAIYLAVVLVIALALGLGGCPTGFHRDEVLQLGLEEMIRPAPGVPPMRIVRSSPEGIWCQDRLGQDKLVPYEDIRSGKAVRIPGIRQAIDVEYLEKDQAPPGYPYVIDKKNRGVAELRKKEAIENYLQSGLPGKEASLFVAVRLFQQALAYYGTTFLPDSAENKMRLEATRQLIDNIHNLYTKAITFEKAGDYPQAWAAYDAILKHIPRGEEKNPIFRNVSQRMAALRQKMKRR